MRHAAIDEARFVRAFAAEIAATAARVPGRTVSTIFFGGGTPSLMQPATVGAILDAIAEHWSIAPDVEITLEANPTSVEATRFRGYRAAGVNRVSLGVQALDDAALKELGRLHTAQEALDAVAIARVDLSTRYSFDLIYARPGQTPAGLGAPSSSARSREAAEHLSLYQLTIEQDTPFHALHAAGKLVDPGRGHGARALRHDAGDLRRAPACRPTRFPITRGRAPNAGTTSSTGACSEYAGIGPGAHGRLDDRRRAPRHRDREAAGGLADAGRGVGHGVVTDEVLTREERGRRVPADGPAARRRHRPGALCAARRPPARSGAHRDAARARAWSRPRADGRLRVTPAGFPVLDAVVADLAA